MSEKITLRKSPKLEFELQDIGFHWTDEESEQVSGFCAYNDLTSIDLNKPWYPMLAKCLRVTTWMLNGVPYFPDAATCKKANLIIRSHKGQLGLWLTNATMARKAKKLKQLLDDKTKLCALA